MRSRPFATAFAIVGWTSALPTLAAPSDAMLQKLLERVEKLESRNAQLEKEVQALKREKEMATEERSTERSPEREPAERPSGREPEIAARLEAVEKDVQAMKKPAALAEKLDGIAVDAALTTVWQNATGLPHGTEGAENKLNYRADITVEVPLEEVGMIEQKLFAHVRIGQGEGLNGSLGLLGHFGVPNAAAFKASGANADDSVAILGEAWYQAGISFGEDKKHRLEATLGKMDTFGFFDQNEAAGDEATQFLNAAFVHNPLLDAGGEVGVDANGFQPGVVLSYLNETNGAEPWRLSLGAFGAGSEGSNYQKTGDSPLMIAQVEKTLKLFGGHDGNYRLYAWSRSHDVPHPHFTHDDFSSRHTGFGLSFDQQFGRGVKLFGRYGHLTSGKMPFDRAAVLGAEINGAYWGRAADAVGIAGAWLRASKAYKRAGGEGFLSTDHYDDHVENGAPADFTFRPSGAEQTAELYYRVYLTPNLSLTPDVQWTRHSGANPRADDVTTIGLRANVSY
ncbi:MAG: carbohydrate porin [Azoarcus sp.]|jgi:hypothetical protein|nr:carbohydrate porin [Azoarcus sp.]